MFRKFITTFISGLALIAGLGLVYASASSVASADSTTHLRQTLNADGTWTTEVNGKVVNVAAETATAITPIAGNYFSWATNPERLLCIKDYTPEQTMWDVNRVAQEWSKANEFHVWWDDMNGGGTNCGTYDARQTINLYSNSSPGAAACGSVDMDLGSGGVILRATAWATRDADNRLCRQTFTLRQNIISALVGRILGLQFHTQFADSVMNAYLTYKLQIPYPRPADFYGISARY